MEMDFGSHQFYKRILKMNTFKDFTNKYGTDTTTNFELIQWSKQLRIPNFHYCMKDEIKKLKRIKKLPIYCITNYHNSNQPGIHHVCFMKDKDKSYYFDSYGLSVLKEAEDFLQSGIYSTFQLQNFTDKYCGSICMFVLFKLSKGKDYFDIILELKNELSSSIS